jgi:hypothetical protein
MFSFVSSQTSVDVWKDGFYKFTYSIDEKAGTFTFTLDVGTKGWVGIGISPNGYMPESDVIMCYVDSNGKAVVVDAYAKARSLPDLDTTLGTTNDITNISGSFNNNRTVISFTRRLDTGDKFDIPIKKDDTIRMIFSARETGSPSSEGSFLMHTKAKVLSLVVYKSAQTTLPATSNAFNINSEVISLKYDKFPVPNTKTNYVCKFFNLKELLKVQKNVSTLPKLHAIRFEAIIDTRTVHHILIFGCPSGTVQQPGYIDCGNAMNKDCTTVIGLTGPNSDDMNMPPEAGFLWGSDDTEVVYMQVHYENPTLSSNILDSSGFKIYFTDVLRPYNLGVTIFGTPMQKIRLPPGQNSVVISDTCTSSCTQQLGSKGIKIAFVALHGHTLLRKIRLEIASQAKVDNTTFRTDAFDFEVQYMNLPNTPYQVNAGDQLTTICEYDTSKIANITYGGEATNNEMCFSFVGYYPKESGMQTCMSGFCLYNTQTPPPLLPTGSSTYLSFSFIICLIAMFLF